MGIVITQELFEERFKEKYGTEFIPISKYKGYDQDVIIQHKACGHTFTKKGAEICSKSKCKIMHCPKCNPLLPGVSVIPSINDLSVTATEICKFLVDPNDAHRYRKNSKNKIWFRCPVCGNEHLLTIANVVKSGHVTCPMCNDGFSYPNKFMANILKQLNVEYIAEYQPDWIKPFRYDFCLPNDNLIIEMDGELGHGHKQMVDYDTVKRDNVKDQKAHEHGLSVIRIDCCYKSNRFEHIKNSILSSALIDVLDLSNIDWNICNKRALTSKLEEVLHLFKQKVAPEEIKKQVCIKQSCLNNYFRILVCSGQISQAELDLYRKTHRTKRLQTRQSRPTRSRSVFCYETGEIFEFIKDAEIRYNTKGIGQSIVNKGTCAGMHWEYIDALPDNFNFASYQIPKTQRKQIITNYYIEQYDKNNNFMCRYDNMNQIIAKYHFTPQNIYRVLSKQRKTAYGYIWKKIYRQETDGLFIADT